MTNPFNRSQTIEIFSHLIFWGLIVVFSGHVKISTDDLLTQSLDTEFNRLGVALNMLVFYLNYLLLIPRYMSRRLGLYLLTVILLVCSTGLIETAIDKLTYLSVEEQSNTETLQALLFVNLLLHSVFWLLSVLMRLGRDWFINQQNQQLIKAQQTQSELALLKSQVHPHFLFNTLNTLYSSSYEYGDEETANGIGKLSHLLRYMLYETQDEQVPLDNEVDYLQDYIDLQTMRFTDDVTVTFNIKGDVDNITVSPMLLITLVENAFKHGISPAKHSTIDIELAISNGQINLTVENDIHPQRAKSALEGDAGGLGLENLKRRLALLYPQRHQLSIMAKQQRHYSQLTLMLS